MTNLEVRAIAEAVADVLVERGLVAASPTGAGGRVLDALAVAELLGRDRQWVYDHADELGAFRYGDGPRARIGFDVNAVERWKRERRRNAVKPKSRPQRATSMTLIPYEGSGRGAQHSRHGSAGEGHAERRGRMSRSSWNFVTAVLE